MNTTASKIGTNYHFLSRRLLTSGEPKSISEQIRISFPKMGENYTKTFFEGLATSHSLSKTRFLVWVGGVETWRVLDERRGPQPGAVVVGLARTSKMIWIGHRSRSGPD